MGGEQGIDEGGAIAKFLHVIWKSELVVQVYAESLDSQRWIAIGTILAVHKDSGIHVGSFYTGIVGLDRANETSTAMLFRPQPLPLV